MLAPNAAIVDCNYFERHSPRTLRLRGVCVPIVTEPNSDRENDGFVCSRFIQLLSRVFDERLKDTL